MKFEKLSAQINNSFHFLEELNSNKSDTERIGLKGNIETLKRNKYKAISIDAMILKGDAGKEHSELIGG